MQSAVQILRVLILLSLTSTIERVEGQSRGSVSPVPVTAQGIVLNEILASNTQGLEDEDGDKPDWLELHNPGAGAVDLVGVGLSDDPDRPFKWRFPRILINPGGYILVYCSGKNRTNTGAALHASFALRASGETVLLTNAQGQRLDEKRVPGLMGDVSWGRRKDVLGEWVFFAFPTPRAANGKDGFASLLRAPTADPPGGFYSQAVEVGLSTRELGAELHYTLDGSEPTTASPVYEAPLRMNDRSNASNVISMIPGTATVNQHTDGWFPPRGLVAKSWVLRARVFREGAMPSATMTQSYFVGARSPARYKLPVISLATETNGLFGYETGIYVLGKVFDDYRKTHPTEPLTGHTPANYQGRGAAWRRAAHLEWFDPSGSPLFRAEVDLEVQGQSSRSFRQKSLGIHPLGTNFSGEIFPGLRARGTGDALNRFNRLRLANSGNDWSITLLRDGFCHTLASAIGIDVLANQPAVLFIDGEFWGIHNVREQQDTDHIASHYGLERRDVVLCEGAGSLLEGRPGDESLFVSLREFISTNDLSQPMNLDPVRERMDVENFLRYCAAEIYFANADWPHNNIRFWRKRTNGFVAGAPPGHDGRWRWMLYDVDLGYAHPWSGGFGDNTLAAATNPKGRPPLDAPWSTVLLRQLLKNPGVQDLFLSLLADFLNTSFREERALTVLDSMVETLSFAIPEHIQRWRTMGDSPAGWTNNLRALRLFASQRPIYVRQHAVAQFKLAGYGLLTVDSSPPAGGKVRVNSISIEAQTPGVNAAQPYPWRGVYFRGVPIRLEAVASPGWVFAGWSGSSVLGTNAVASFPFQGESTVQARFSRVPPKLTSIAIQWPSLLAIGAIGGPLSSFALERSADLKRWAHVTNSSFDSHGSARWMIDAAPLGDASFFRLVEP